MTKGKDLVHISLSCVNSDSETINMMAFLKH